MYTAYNAKQDWLVHFLGMEFSKSLKQFRAKHGWTQKAAAEQLGLSLYRYGNIERCTSTPPLPIFLVLCFVMELNPLDYLWGDSGFCRWLVDFRPDVVGEE